jgi:hypothetical protein
MTLLDAWGMGMNKHFDEKIKQNAIHMDEFQMKTHHMDEIDQLSHPSLIRY